MVKWSVNDIPPGGGRTALVTGTGGIGLEDALALARRGWDVTIAGRNAERGGSAVARVGSACPGATVRFERVDLASLASVRDFGERMRGERRPLDLLINNAAVMAPPKRRVTADDFELQFGTNHLGHFALTAALLPLLRAARRPRVVTVSSIAARGATLRLDDLQSTRDYRPMTAYGQSKLANLMFAFHLQAVSDQAGWGLASMASHPGLSRTDLISNGAGRWSASGVLRMLLGPVTFQTAAQGALPTLYAATSPDAEGGAYYGPSGFGELRGSPAIATIPAPAMDRTSAVRLWQASERLTGSRMQ